MLVYDIALGAFVRVNQANYAVTLKALIEYWLMDDEYIFGSKMSDEEFDEYLASK